MKYIFVTGGVVSSIGKGISAASIGALLEARKLKVTLVKLDPYINVDPGTMSPFQHGEVFVTADGAETDLDLGHYERFVRFKATQENNFTTGQVYKKVIERERKGDYLGATVQVLPHVTDEIKRRIRVCAKNYDVIIVEIGGTVGDIESLPFVEAIRQMGIECGRQNVAYVHLTFLPHLKPSDELKTKPTQHSVKELRSIGIQPDVLMCRSEFPYTDSERNKISLYTNVPAINVINVPDVEDVHCLPGKFSNQKVDEILLKHLGLKSEWNDFLELKNNLTQEITIAMVGKYVHLTDSYKSLNEALKHAGFHTQTKVNIRHIDSEEINSSADLENVDGILIPGGFGERGLYGKLFAATYAREQKIPFLGICLGMQIAGISFARYGFSNSVSDGPDTLISKANSTEFDPDTPHKIFDLLSSLKPGHDMGGTMRLGEYPCKLSPNSRTFEAYKKEMITERHRHRYEFNVAYIDKFNKAGMKVVGINNDQEYPLVEIIELDDHPWYVGVQFHPEFTSNPRDGHPLFEAFITACRKK
jgi:CTP synthase